jgi:hypothetical protein
VQGSGQPLPRNSYIGIHRVSYLPLGTLHARVVRLFDSSGPWYRSRYAVISCEDGGHMTQHVGSSYMSQLQASSKTDNESAGSVGKASYASARLWLAGFRRPSFVQGPSALIVHCIYCSDP